MTFNKAISVLSGLEVNEGMTRQRVVGMANPIQMAVVMEPQEADSLEKMLTRESAKA